MDITVLETKANKKSTYIVLFSFANENGESATPKTFSWVFSDEYGNIIRQATVSTMESIIPVVLFGDDLDCGAGSKKRTITGIATYDSQEYGSDLPLTGEAEFEIIPCVNVA